MCFKENALIIQRNNFLKQRIISLILRIIFLKQRKKKAYSFYKGIEYTFLDIYTTYK